MGVVDLVRDKIKGNFLRALGVESSGVNHNQSSNNVIRKHTKMLLSLVKQDSHVADSGFRVKNRHGTSRSSGNGEKQLRVADLSAKVPSELNALAKAIWSLTWRAKEVGRWLDHQRLKLLDAFRAPGGVGSSPDEHDNAADENSYGGGYNHGKLTILDEHGAQFGGDDS
ncbi:hypothetical protein HID58_071002 [Brassica napus]|uniref:Uncharacterized protein n=1 Tax=Brassica napus TaxID=3708 RepID=A0ABQ7Z0G2_BRANA|nr:hypothetical protein HID58_071002 [Brassica napus]